MEKEYHPAGDVDSFRSDVEKNINPHAAGGIVQINFSRIKLSKFDAP
jgi:hypothetical protein